MLLSLAHTHELIALLYGVSLSTAMASHIFQFLVQTGRYVQELAHALHHTADTLPS